MRPRLKILVTDGGYKHSSSIIRNILTHYSNADIYAHSDGGIADYWLPSKKWCTPIHGSLRQILLEDDFDAVIPISGEAVKVVASLKCKQALFPDPFQLDSALDKRNLGTFITDLGIQYPDTADYRLGEEPSIEYPFVLKSANETQAKIEAAYIDDRKALRNFESKNIGNKTTEVHYIAQRRIRGTPRRTCRVAESVERTHQGVRQATGHGCRTGRHEHDASGSSPSGQAEPRAGRAAGTDPHRYEFDESAAE